MQPDLVITTTADYELYEHLNAACYIMYRRKQSFLITTIATIILGMYLGVTSYMDKDWLYLYVITPIWILVFLMVSYFLTRTKGIANRAAKRSLRYFKNGLSMIQYAFFQDHIGISSKNASTQAPYTGINCLAETSKFFLIFTNKVNAHCVRKRDLGPSNVDLFRTYMQDKTGLKFHKLNY